MPRAFTGCALAVAIAGPAWGQTTWTSDRFTVSTANETAVEIVDGTVHLLDLPMAFANPGSNPGLVESVFDLTFAPRGSNVLVGEQVSFTVDMTLDTFDLPADFLIKPSGRFTMDIDGVAPTTRSIDGGVLHFGGGAFIGSPTFDARASAFASEGFACPLGSAANDCDFGRDLAFLDATVRFESITLTPMLKAVPEPGMAWMWLAGLGICLAGTTTAGARPQRRSATALRPPRRRADRSTSRRRTARRSASPARCA